MIQKEPSSTPQTPKRAFLSVFDKTGLAPLAKALVETYGYELLATGGTKTHLEEKGIPVRESSEITGFDELLGGRVKSLHPEIFAGILAERDNPTHDVPFLIDTVVVNLYPFEQEQASEAKKQPQERDDNHLLHFIDIGGSSLIRAAAKNYRFVTVLTQASDYTEFLTQLEKNKGEADKAFRQAMALKAFQRSVSYDTAITCYFQQLTASPTSKTPSPDEGQHIDTLPNQVTLQLEKIQDLRYGENPYQKAALYGLNHSEVDFKVLHGKELSYNNLLDLQAGWNIVREFSQTPACAVIKHNNPCGVAISNISIHDAYSTAFFADPLSAFGGVVALNKPVDEKTALEMKEVFLEVIIAPDFTPEAMAILTTKRNLRLVQRDFIPVENIETLDYKQVSPHLFLIQTQDPGQLQGLEARLLEEELLAATDKKPRLDQLQDMIFAWKVVKHVKSNAIVLAKEGKTVGIGGGQTSRIGALENALKHACDEAKDSVMASDGFFPHEDNIYAAVQARVGAIIQPGGSIKDKDIITLANQYQLPMVLTGVREFKH
ncbi:MAG: bifunctional phosphoribosylaminoimidazolecarboxamide formyltransferase/IMP cyclohydrolase [Cyanobacteria bacterium]|nr:bifunctional phosphoribosylaminoimidazolecarboxamide formyltransferase/IMP cyclohydrolase [Cyanobacteriota bacterium]